MTAVTHFSLADFTRSDIAAARGIDNTMPDSLRPAAQMTLEMGERIRAHLSALAGHDVPILVSSGYRCPRLNYAARNPHAADLGEDATGDHPKASAMDFTAPAYGTPLEVAKALALCVDALQIGQLIYEGTWVHASWRMPLRLVNRVLTIRGGPAQIGIVG